MPITNIDFDIALSILFPSGWLVDAEMDFVDNVINKIFLEYEAANQDARIAIGDTGLFLTEMDATLNNLANPANITISGHAQAEFGDEVKIFGNGKATIFTVDGSFFVDKDELKLDATVYFGAVEDDNGNTTGLLGKGTGDLLLDWAEQTYSLDVKSSLYDGAFTFEEEFEFFGGSDILISAKAEVNVPKGIPFIGGKELAEFDFLFKFEAPETKSEKPGGFVAAWTKVKLLFTNVDVGFQFDFASGDARVIGSSQINADKKSASNEGSQTYIYPATFTVPKGATRATLQVEWPTAGGTQTIGVSGDGWKPASADSQGRLLQEHFNSTQDKNFVGLIPEYNSSKTLSVSLEGSNTDDDFAFLPVQSGNYTLYLFSSVKFDPSDLVFQGTFHFPKPTLDVSSSSSQNDGTVPMQLQFELDPAFVDQTRVNVYIDQYDPTLGPNEQAFNGTLIESLSNKPVTLSDNSQKGTLEIQVPVEGLFPIPYYIYAVIDDGTNTSVISTVADPAFGRSRECVYAAVSRFKATCKTKTRTA